MIKLSNAVFPSQQQLYFAVEGMRNPKNSWGSMDTPKTQVEFKLGDDDIKPQMVYGYSDLTLSAKLAVGGEPHRKYMRMLQVGVRIEAPMYWWKEFDTYKIGTVRNSCSTMHKIMAKEFDICDFSHDQLDLGDIDILKNIIERLNLHRDTYLYLDKLIKEFDTDPSAVGGQNKKLLKKQQKAAWYKVIQLLPSSYNQIANVTMNYEVLCNIYKWRKGHKLNEWRDFCYWVETIVPYHELITKPKSILED